jgi:type IV secretion system protein VirB9
VWRIILIILCVGVTKPAFALGETAPGKDDTRMRTAPYKADQIYPVHIAKGQSFIIAVNSKETITDTYGQEKGSLSAERDQLGHIISLHTENDKIDPPRSFTIITRREDGETRRYMLQVDVVPADEAQISLTYAYPNEFTAAQIAAWKIAQAAKAQKADEAALQATQQAEHCNGHVNNHYALQGAAQADWDLLPTREVCDDGEKTYFHFPGNMSIPLIYATDDDGKEILADYTFNSVSRVATVHRIARAFHLHSGLNKTSLLCVFNRAYDPIGVRSTSNTVSPNIRQNVR